MGEMTRHYLETYARGGEVDGGWLHAKASQQARLDDPDAGLPERRPARFASCEPRQAEGGRAATIQR
jgi:hypothetical protein